ncbi:MAG TPA: cytochrome c [Vicinamibacterales bacterium]|nr:cytochrome c [Vicinamibacterales bacterium]
MMRSLSTPCAVLALAGWCVTAGSSRGVSAPLVAAELARQKNPIPASEESVKAGRTVYSRFCRSCHGLQGKGDGVTAPAGSKPANLVDATWDHGGTDAQIFKTIKEGIKRKPPADPPYFMEPWGGKISDEDIWNTVNFLRDLAKRAAAKK